MQFQVTVLRIFPLFHFVMTAELLEGYRSEEHEREETYI